MKKTFSLSLAMILFFSTFIVAQAIDGVWHSPYGKEDLYEIESTERFPRDPEAGQNVFIKLNTWPVEMGQSTWVSWKKNGIQQLNKNGDWKYNEGNNTFWEVNLGSFNKGDVIEYYVHANKDGANEKKIGPFSFTVTGWETISKINSAANLSNKVELSATPNTGSFQPKIGISFTSDETFRFQLSPNGSSATTSGLSNYTLSETTSEINISTSKIRININKNPYRLSVYKIDGTLIAKEYDPSINRNVGWLTDGRDLITKVQNNWYTPTNEEFYGFGERYNNIRKRGTNVDTYVYNQYRNQNEKTYTAIPFFLNTKGYGVLVNSTYYSNFKLATEKADMYTFTSDSGGKKTSILDYYFFGGNNFKEVMSNYSSVTAKPTLPPKWAFGLWMSANEWDRQSEVISAINNSKQHDIPATAIVLEQWSDENTFYIFNDAQYTPKAGSEAFKYSDFTFPQAGKWPNPKQMVNDVHANNMKLLLWQVPIQKYTSYAYQQKDNDEAYMISQGYGVKTKSGSPYRIPSGTWFGDSLLLDFTNPLAENWWLSKRQYLLDEIGIDGFKTDGGEMVWGRDTLFSNGKTGDEMRNQYPNEYIRAYYDFAKQINPDSMTFSRAGTTGIQKYPALWGGDQDSSFYAYQQAINAGLTSNLSGVPFWSWDLAGFTGNYPSSELYKRSTAMAAFSPIMQFHSEKASPSPSEERSPWNAAARTGDQSIISTFSKFVNTRMNLLPYIYSEAKKSSDTGIPLMRAMVFDYPNDSSTYGLDQQYMFGDNLLVAPIVKEGETLKQVYLPQGEWVDFWWGASKPGGRTINYYAGVDDLPVFVKAGSILPMNLNEQYKVGGTIGNDLKNHTNLTFRVYPKGASSYQWFDDVNNNTKTIQVDENEPLSKITVTLPGINQKTTLQVLASKPSNVLLNGVAMQNFQTKQDFINSITGWYYDSYEKLTYIKTSASTSSRTISLEGVNESEYEAEFANLASVTTNNNHSGYTGTGFVDGFETSGDNITFDVQAEATGSYKLKIKYSSAGGNAKRSVYVNNTKITSLTLSQTANWDTWGIGEVTVNLQKGINTIKMQFDSTDSLGINVDNISIKPL
jgi:alpha-glucosidase (family GH31 glycosyl hydrolase)